MKFNLSLLILIKDRIIINKIFFLAHTSSLINQNKKKKNE